MKSNFWPRVGHYAALGFVGFLQLLWWLRYGFLIALLLFGCGKLLAHEEEQRIQREKECDARGGFVMVTHDGYVCLDKSLRK